MGQEQLDSPQEAINKQASEFPMSGTASDLCCCGSVSDSFYDTTGDDLFVDVNYSCVVVKGRLQENIAFWQNIGASNWLLRVIREGYSLPFVELPEVKFFQNHKSALCNAEFVSPEISKLLKLGALVEVSPTDLLARNSSRKLTLIEDLRYVNQHLRSHKFKYEDNVQQLICSSKVTGSSNLTIPVDITMWKFLQSIQSSSAALGWLIVRLSFLSLPCCLSAFQLVLLSLQRSKKP